MIGAKEARALLKIRLEFEHSTDPTDWPAACEPQLLLLHDVLGALGADAKCVRRVLGGPAFDHVQAVLNLEACGRLVLP